MTVERLTQEEEEEEEQVFQNVSGFWLRNWNDILFRILTR